MLERYRLHSPAGGTYRIKYNNNSCCCHVFAIDQLQGLKVRDFLDNTGNKQSPIVSPSFLFQSSSVDDKHCSIGKTSDFIELIQLWRNGEREVECEIYFVLAVDVGDGVNAFPSTYRWSLTCTLRKAIHQMEKFRYISEIESGFNRPSRCLSIFQDPPLMLPWIWALLLLAPLSAWEDLKRRHRKVTF